MKNILKFIRNRHFNFISTRNISVDKHYDICIVGGGPIGFCLASSLGTEKYLKSKKVLVLEAQKERKYIQNSQFSNRTVALSPQTRHVLETCGAWENIQKERVACVKKMLVWEQSSESFISFDDNLAYIVETDILQHSIISTLHNRSNVEVIYGESVNEIEIKDNKVNLTLSNGSRICASLIVGADGFQSKVRKMSHIESIVLDSNQKAIVAVVKFPDEANNNPEIAWQRFTRLGPIAYLPLDKNHSNLIWSTSGPHADQLMSLGEKDFVDELNREMFTDQYKKSRYLNKVSACMDTLIDRMPSKLKDANDYWKHKQNPPTVTDIVPQSRDVFPLGFMHAINYVSKNVALIGDSAHRILPLAGQGVNLGFGDVECLVRCLSDGAQLGEVINNYFRLQKYETERQRYVLPVAMTVQGLHQLYSTEFTPFVFGRAVGLKIVNSIKPFKNFFLHGATQGKILNCC